MFWAFLFFYKSTVVGSVSPDLNHLVLAQPYFLTLS